MRKEMTFEEVLARESPKMQKRVEKETSRFVAEYVIMQIRKDLALSQAKLASRLGVSQAAVNKVEHQGKDLKLSTLKRYIEALGGEVRLEVKMPTGKIRKYSL